MANEKYNNAVKLTVLRFGGQFPAALTVLKYLSLC